MTESIPVTKSDSDPSDQFGLEVVLKTDVGLVRSENQDYGLLSRPEDTQVSGERLMMVADGMGGHRGGATASRLAATTVQSELMTADRRDIAAALGDAFRRANAKIYEESQANPELRGMGTTGSALVIHDGKAHFAHVGDSRIYLVRDGEIRQLTEDHSVVASLVREGLLSRSEADVHPRRNVLQRSIGVSSDVEVDVSDPIEVKAGDTFLLCSDGLHGVVKEEEMKQVAVLPTEEAASEFIRRALERGAPDNVTVIVARVVARAPKVERQPSSPDLVGTFAPGEGEDSTSDALSQEEKIRGAAGQSRSMIPWILLLLLVLAGAGAAVYYMASAPATSSTPRTTS